MDLNFSQLKLLVTIVADDLLEDDFDNFQDSCSDPKSLSDVSEEMYDKVYLLKELLNELYKHRPLPF